MAKNALATAGKKRQYVAVATILKDNSQRSRLMNYIDETVRCKTKILDEQESIRTLRDAAVEELNIEPKLFVALVNMAFNNNYEQRKMELEAQVEAIEALMGTGLNTSSDDE
jgi:hypothetical protein